MGKIDHPPCDFSPHDAFARQGGITNGAKWYALKGGMQDFNYLATNAMEITLELSCEKFPPADRLPREWMDNKNALLNYIWQSHIGVKGLVIDSASGEPIPQAIVWVKNLTGETPTPIMHPVTTTDLGEYWRLLTPGKFELVVQAEGYLPASKTVTVDNTAADKKTGQAQRLDFSLQLDPELAAQMVQEQQQEEQQMPEETEIAPEWTDEQLEELYREIQQNP